MASWYSKTKLRNVVKAKFERLFDVRIYSNHAHGREYWFDVNQTQFPTSIVFDVGANHGQSASVFSRVFPDARIFCFEPVSHNFDHLLESTRDRKNVESYKFALGSEDCMLDIYVEDLNTMCSFVSPTSNSVKTETVKVKALDNFCDENGIDKIDFLKIDVEGFELQVLEGAHRMLTQNKIAFIFVECAFQLNNERHVSFEAIRVVLDKFNFKVFGIYDQQLEWSGEKSLRYANVLFCNQILLNP